MTKLPSINLGSWITVWHRALQGYHPTNLEPCGLVYVSKKSTSIVLRPLYTLESVTAVSHHQLLQKRKCDLVSEERRTQTGKPESHQDLGQLLSHSTSISLFMGPWGFFFFPPVFLCADLLHSPFCGDHFFSFFVNTEEDSHPQAPQFADPSRGQHRLVTVPNSLEEDFEHSAWLGMHPFPISYNWADRIHVAQKQGHRVPWVEAQSLEKGVCINVLAFFSSIRGKH